MMKELQKNKVLFVKNVHRAIKQKRIEALHGVFVFNASVWHEERSIFNSHIMKVLA